MSKWGITEDLPAVLSVHHKRFQNPETPTSSPFKKCKNKLKTNIHIHKTIN